MRTKHSFLNMLVNTVPNLILPILGFIKFSLFTTIYGGSINGMYSTFLQIMGVLNLVEGGFGIALQQKLYGPLAQNDNKKVTELYNGAIYLFRIMGVAILAIGTLVGLFQPLFLKTETFVSPEMIYGIYFILLIPVAISYFLMGPNIVVQADQQYYKINVGIQIIMLIRSVLVLVLALSGVPLVITLLVDGVLTILSYAYSRFKAFKLYPYLKNNKSDRDLSTIENTKHVFAHKISGVILSNTDPILLSTVIGTLFANVYNSYNLITSSLLKILFSIVQAPVDSFGHLFSSDEEHKYSTFLEYVNFSFFLSSIVGTILFIVMNDFVLLWMKDAQYILPLFAVFLFAANLYYLVSREPIMVVRNVNGLFKESKQIAYWSAFSNLGLSIVLIKPLGITGVLLGTFLTHVIIDFALNTNLVYEKVFHISAWNYYRLVFNRTLIAFILGGIGYVVWHQVFISGVPNLLIWFVGAAILGTILLILHVGLYYLFFKDFRAFLVRGKRIILRK
ncbi:MAG: lipopolysaccharide biosynthesis protein [Turicibacter sp.]